MEPATKSTSDALTDYMHTHWLAKLIEWRNLWIGQRSGRRIVEELDRVQLFERDRLVVEIVVKNGNIEDAKAEALMVAVDADAREKSA